MRRTVVIGGLAGAAALAVLFLSPAKAEACPLLSKCESPPTTQGNPPTPPPLPIPTTTTTRPKPAPDTAAAARRLLVLVNQERKARGLGALARRGDVDAIAVGHSKNMEARRELWHNDAYFTKATKDRLGAKSVGENVAMNGSVEDMHRRLMNSPRHRDNILDGRFEVIGIGVAASSDGLLFATEDFAQLRAAAPAPAPSTNAKAARGTKPKATPRAGVKLASAAPAIGTAAALRDLPNIALGDSSEFSLAGGLGGSKRSSSRGGGVPVLPVGLVALTALAGTGAFILHRRSVLAETASDDPRAGGG